MSKLTEIEAALMRIDQAGFQRLCDAYLRKRGYKELNPFGVAFGREKTTTGTPDTFVTQPDGNYVFAEYTTQQTGVVANFTEDLKNCFDENKTDIPTDRIAEVVLCCNSKLSPQDFHDLAKLCQAKGVLLTTVGLGYLAHELNDKYPRLAAEYLGVEMDSGQILHPDEFAPLRGAA